MNANHDDDDYPRAELESPQLCDRRLLEILVCPVSKGPLVYDARRQELISARASLAYPIRDGVPLLTMDSARPLD